MPTFLISYDLHHERDYRMLTGELAEKGAVKILESIWLYAQPTTAEQLRDTIASYLDGDDSVIVLELKPDSDWATLRVPAKATNWLRTKVTS